MTTASAHPTRPAFPQSRPARVRAAAAILLGLLAVLARPAAAGPAIVPDPALPPGPAAAPGTPASVATGTLTNDVPLRAGGNFDGEFSVLGAPDGTAELRAGGTAAITGVPGARLAGSGAGGGADAAARPAGVSEIARMLINRVPGAGGGAAAQNDAVTNGVIGALIEENMADVVTSVLTPEVGTDGLVTFSVGGFGSFALVSTGEDGGLYLVDMERGTAMKVYQDRRPIAQIRAAPERDTMRTRPTGEPRGGPIEFFKQEVLPVLISPITLGIVGLFVVLWVIWRLSTAAAQ